jgi:hypothetical protein
MEGITVRHPGQKVTDTTLQGIIKGFLFDEGQKGVWMDHEIFV